MNLLAFSVEPLFGMGSHLTTLRGTLGGRRPWRYLWVWAGVLWAVVVAIDGDALGRLEEYVWVCPWVDWAARHS